MNIEKTDELESDFLTKLPILNFTLAVLIVFHHSFNINVNYNVIPSNVCSENITWFIERFMYNISECAVPVFFFISGYLFFRNYQLTLSGYRYKLKKRYFSLVIPYIFYNSLGYLKHLIFSSNIGSFKDYIISVFNSTTMPLWFIRELIIYTLISPIVYYCIRKKILLLFVCVTAIIFVLIGLVPYRSFIYWIPFYCAGGIFNEFKIKRSCINVISKIHSKITLFLIVILCIFSLLLPNAQKMTTEGILIFYLFRILSVPIIIIVTFKTKGKKLTRSMKYSFFIYCTHLPVITLIQSLFAYFDNFVFSKLIEYFTTVLLTLFIVCNIAYIIQKKCPKIWKVMNGWR